MVHVIGYAESLADELGHAGARPQIRGEPGDLGALEQDPLEALLGPRIQLRGTAGSRFRLQTLVTGFPVGPVPAANTAAIDPDQACHFDGLMALQEKPNGTKPTPLQFLWASTRSHRWPPAQSIGH